MSNCIFCNIVSNKAFAYIIYQDSYTTAFLDINPANRGHTLIVPNKHFENIFDINKLYLNKTFETVKNICKKLKKVYRYNDINIVQSTGVSAGQEIFHFHVHLIPRQENDKISFEYTSINKKLDLEIIQKELS